MKQRKSLGAIAMHRCPPEGLRVRFEPTPVSMVMYKYAPPPGTTGTVAAIPLGAYKRTCMPGPGGGLVYVRWDSSKTTRGYYSVSGVSSLDLVYIAGRKAKRAARAR